MRKRREEAPRHSEYLVGPPDPLAQDCELVGADARHQIAFADGAADAFCDTSYDLVAGLVAEAVVQHLEALEIEQENPELLLGLQAAQRSTRSLGHRRQVLVGPRCPSK